MKNLSKNIFLIALLVIINLSIFLFCQLLTDEGNFLWKKTDPAKEQLVAQACMDLMRIRYFVYANSINLFLLGIYFAVYYRKRLGIMVSVLAVGIFFGGNKLFENDAARSYYIIFQNQNVPEDFILEPVKSAGKAIAPLLMKDVDNHWSPRRKYAIAGLGEIDYTESMEKLNEILHSWKENPEERCEAYFALRKMSHERAKGYVRIFDGSAHPIADQPVVDLIKRRTR